jgi:hypothetical protein
MGPAIRPGVRCAPRRLQGSGPPRRSFRVARDQTNAGPRSAPAVASFSVVGLIRGNGPGCCSEACGMMEVAGRVSPNGRFRSRFRGQGRTSRVSGGQRPTPQDSYSRIIYRTTCNEADQSRELGWIAADLRKIPGVRNEILRSVSGNLLKTGEKAREGRHSIGWNGGRFLW